MAYRDLLDLNELRIPLSVVVPGWLFTSDHMIMRNVDAFGSGFCKGSPKGLNHERRVTVTRHVIYFEEPDDFGTYSVIRSPARYFSLEGQLEKFRTLARPVTIIAMMCIRRLGYSRDVTTLIGRAVWKMRFAVGL